MGVGGISRRPQTFQAHPAGVTLKNTIRLKFNQNPAKEQEWEGEGVGGGCCRREGGGKGEKKKK